MIRSGYPAGGAQLAVGVALALCSAACYDAGNIVEKQALGGLPRLPGRPPSLVRTVMGSRRWVAGFVILLAGLALQVLALTVAPVTVVQPILAAGILALVASGRVVLGERLGSRERAALALVLAAVVAIAVSAGSRARLAQTVPAGRFSVTVRVATVLAGAASWVALRGDRQGAGRPQAAVLGLAAGLLYGVGAIAEKAVATHLVGHGLVSGGVSALRTAYPWVFVAATGCGLLVFQLGLQHQPASLLVPLANVVFGACALVAASVVFGELLFPTGWWLAPRWVGFAAVGAAVVVLVAEPKRRATPALA
jgi:hypothetical protein